MVLCIYLDRRLHASRHQRERHRVEVDESLPSSTCAVSQVLPVDHAAILEYHVMILKDDRYGRHERGDVREGGGKVV